MTVVRDWPVSTLRELTEAPGRTPPVESCTMPWSVPVTVWADRAAGNNNATISTNAGIGQTSAAHDSPTRLLAREAYSGRSRRNPSGGTLSAIDCSKPCNLMASDSTRP